MRLRFPTLFLFLIILLFPVSASAQGAGSMFDPIIPEECKCASVAIEGATEGSPATSPSAPSWGCVLRVVQNVINTAVGIAVIVIILAIMYAGFVLMTSSANPQARIQARNVVGNSVLGLFILLGAWLGVDFVMKVVYDPTKTFSGQSLGPWNSILAGTEGSQCLAVRQPTPITSGIVGILFNSPSSNNSSNVGVARGLCADDNPACSVGALKAQGLSEVQARAMSCIAVTESSGNPRGPNSSTGACGTFQITNRTSRSNWQNPRHHGLGCSTQTSCNNAQCNLQTAAIMFRLYGYQPWTGRNRDGTYWNPNAVACVRQYDPGG